MKITIDVPDSAKEMVMVLMQMLKDIKIDGIAEEGESHDETILQNKIFNHRLFDTNDRLLRLRKVIAHSIDMGEYDALFGEPQAVRLNPEVQGEWYYIVKAIEEAKVARRFTVTDFIEQMREWLPEAFREESVADWERYKRRLSKSISDEKSLWRHGRMQTVVSLREMWAKEREVRLDKAKMERIHAAVHQGLLANLVALRLEMEKAR